MAGTQFQQRVGSDRFGNPQVVKSSRAAKGKGGKLIPEIQVAWFELGSKTYKVSVSRIKTKSDKTAQKEGEFWISVTLQSNRQVASRSI